MMNFLSAGRGLKTRSMVFITLTTSTKRHSMRIQSIWPRGKLTTKSRFPWVSSSLSDIALWYCFIIFHLKCGSLRLGAQCYPGADPPVGFSTGEAMKLIFSDLKAAYKCGKVHFWSLNTMVTSIFPPRVTISHTFKVLEKWKDNYLFRLEVYKINDKH